MSRKPSRVLAILLAAPILLGTLMAHADDLYFTDFEEFPEPEPDGDNLWAGTDGWISNDTSSGAQGIVKDFVGGLGKTAYLGFERPNATFTTVARPINYDPAVAGNPEVEFESILCVMDSTNSAQDQFFISFYDIGGAFLAAVVFDNTAPGAEGRIRSWQGLANGTVVESDHGVPFIRGDQTFGFYPLELIAVQIDLSANSWSAQWAGIPLFTNAPFTDPTRTALTLGSVAAEWELSSSSTLFAGDNWLFVADWYIHTGTAPGGPLELTSIHRATSGQTTLSWPGEPGFLYQVVYSDDLQTWHSDLPGSHFSGVTESAPLTYTDTDSGPVQRFYRVERTPAP